MRISATEAARNLSDFLNRVFYRGESFDVERGGRVVAVLRPTTTTRTVTTTAFFQLLKDVEKPDDQFADDLTRIQAEQPDLPESPWPS